MNEHDLTPWALEQLRTVTKRMSRTPIEWTCGGFVWNVCTGCSGAYGAGKPCDYCYANKRASNPFYKKAFPTGFNITYHEDRLLQPLKEKIPAIIFADSMSDLFCNGINKKWTHAVLDVIEIAKQHWFIILTKSPENLQRYLYGLGADFYLGGGDYVENVIIGVSVDRADTIHRIKTLQDFKEDTGAGWHLMASFEPLLEKMPEDLNLDELEWIIIGQRTKPFNNPPEPWVYDIVDKAESMKIPVFVKNNLLDQGYYPIEFRKLYQQYPKAMRDFFKRRNAL
jgi:protein gp37